MTHEDLITLGAFLCGLLAGVTLIMVLTVCFGAIEKIESRISTPGKQLDGIKHVWGNGPIGRWMRAVHLYFFFVFRKLPVYGKTIETRMGDEVTPVPLRLKIALLVPMHLFFLLMIIVFGCSLYLDTL